MRFNSKHIISTGLFILGLVCIIFGLSACGQSPFERHFKYSLNQEVMMVNYPDCKATVSAQIDPIYYDISMACTDSTGPYVVEGFFSENELRDK